MSREGHIWGVYRWEERGMDTGGGGGYEERGVDTGEKGRYR